MVHTLPAAAAAIGRQEKELNGVDQDMALRLAAFTKAALKGKLNHHHRNGVTTVLPLNRLPMELRGPKTEATPTPGQGSLSCQPNPQSLISRHCSTLVRSRGSKAASTHTEIDKKLSCLLGKLHRRQLALAHTHTNRQLEAYSSPQTTAPCPVPGGTPASGDENPLGTLDHSTSGGSSFNLIQSPADSQSSSNAGMDFGEAARNLQQQLECLEHFVDEDLTCSSSDDEDEEEAAEKGRGRGRQR